MPRFRSYNEELLIASTLVGNWLNDVEIDRRKHGLNRDYSKPVKIIDIIQKKFEVPCIFGDSGIILKSLEMIQESNVDFKKIFLSAEIIIAHAGMGTILTAIENQLNDYTLII